MAPRKHDKYSEFGAVVSTTLETAGVSNAALASALNCTPAQVSLLLTGDRHPSPRWVDLIADTLGYSSAQRQELHIKAARSVGFKL